MSAAPNATIVVRALNEGKYLGPLFSALKQQNRQDFDIILVDSGSTDRSVAIAEEHGVQVVHIAKDDFTFGRSLNYGCRVAKGDFLVLLSAHTLPMNDDWLNELLAPFADPNVKVSYGMQRGGDENKFSERCLMQSWFPDSDIVPQAGYFCNNANCAIRREDWQRRPYDESLTGLEDLHWAKQAVAEGGLVAYASRAGIYHIHEETWDKVRKRYYREALAFQDIEPDINYSVSDLVRYTALNIMSDLKSAMIARQIRVLPEIFQFRLTQSRGTFQAFKERERQSASDTSTEALRDLKDRFYHPSPRYLAGSAKVSG
ncbi:MAG: glycosyltransferase family 2 protein [Pseudomonadota bacterium]